MKSSSSHLTSKCSQNPACECLNRILYPFRSIHGDTDGSSGLCLAASHSNIMSCHLAAPDSIVTLEAGSSSTGACAHIWSIDGPAKTTNSLRKHPRGAQADLSARMSNWNLT